MSSDPAAAPIELAASGRARTLRGILLMMVGFFFYATADMVAKVLTQSMHPIQVAWVRQFGLLAGVVTLLAIHGAVIMRSRYPVLQICRGLTVVAASTSFVIAITYVPLADAVAITFLAPFIVTVLGALVLGERVGPHRWIAVALGFAGTLVIIRPGQGMLHPAILLALIAAAAFAFRQVISRVLTGSDPISTTVVYTGLTATMALTLPLPFFWSTPASGIDLLLMAAMAAAAGCGELAIIRALELAEVVVLSPLQYTLIVWSTMWGFLVFTQLPDMWTLTGTGLVVASGIYTIWREARAGRT